TAPSRHTFSGHTSARSSHASSPHHLLPPYFFSFFLNDPAPTEIYTFPYTTLFRSSAGRGGFPIGPMFAVPGRGSIVYAAWTEERSEEHTSELQSQSNLVCRLLLEKKKKQKHYKQQPY